MGKAVQLTTKVAPKGTFIGLMALLITIESLSGVVQGFLNPILPALGPVFDIDAPTINGIFLIANVSFAVLTPLISRLGDRFGYKRVLLASTVLVAAGVGLLSFVPSLIAIIAGVILITCVVGFIPLMMGILRLTRPEETRRGVSYLIGTLMIMVGIGGLVAGVLGAVDPLRGFWIGIPFAVAAIICALLLPDTPNPAKEPIAALPMISCLVGIILFMTGLSMAPDWGWGSWRTLVSIVLGAGLLAAWALMDSRPRDEVRRFTDLRMLKLRSIRSVSIATFFFGFASISYFGTNGLVLHSDRSSTGYGFDFSPMIIAVILAVTSLFSLFSSLSAGPIMNRISERVALVSSGLLLAGGFVVFLVAGHTLIGYFIGFSIFNLALGSYQSATRALSVEGVPVEETSSAAGINELALSVGIACGAAVIKMLSSMNVDAQGAITEQGIHLIWATLAVASVVAAVAGSRFSKRQFTRPIRQA
ncbi:MFS transporter [Glutamicibacter sp. FBE19]|uniref:MFS transporter n=1 Tax=Glutamicibacter sp. FBE19 TaxID=2761534 RepID=UPI0018965BA6|nr:MFS transporter [Glutamicibacter sp. FBE19]MBF6672791.1 MFS transporter [Glutamicibacter sp. FBE19]